MMQTVGVVIVQGNRYIAQKRDNKPHISDPGKISTWGGQVEGNETPVQAAVRELREETGVIVDLGQLIFLTDFVMEGRSLKNRGKKVRVYQYAVELEDTVVVHCFEGESIVRMLRADIDEQIHTDLLINAIGLYEQQKSQSK